MFETSPQSLAEFLSFPLGYTLETLRLNSPEHLHKAITNLELATHFNKFTWKRKLLLHCLRLVSITKQLEKSFQGAVQKKGYVQGVG